MYSFALVSFVLFSFVLFSFVLLSFVLLSFVLLSFVLLSFVLLSFVLLSFVLLSFVLLSFVNDYNTSLESISQVYNQVLCIFVSFIPDAFIYDCTYSLYFHTKPPACFCTPFAVSLIHFSLTPTVLLATDTDSYSAIIFPSSSI